MQAITASSALGVARDGPGETAVRARPTRDRRRRQRGGLTKLAGDAYYRFMRVRPLQQQAIGGGSTSTDYEGEGTPPGREEQEEHGGAAGLLKPALASYWARSARMGSTRAARRAGA